MLKPKIHVKYKIIKSAIQIKLCFPDSEPSGRNPHHIRQTTVDIHPRRQSKEIIDHNWDGIKLFIPSSVP